MTPKTKNDDHHHTTTTTIDSHINGEYLFSSPLTKPCQYRDNPSKLAPVFIDPLAPSSIRNEQIGNVVAEICPSMLIDDSAGKRLKIEKLGGGLSNRLFVVTALWEGQKSMPRESTPSPSVVLVRLHSDNDDDDVENTSLSSSPSFCLVDRDVENRISAFLSKNELAPSYFGRFLNGRVEEFYSGYRTLSCGEMKKLEFSVPIAKAIAEFHQIAVPSEIFGISMDVAVGQHGTIWDRVQCWLEKAIQVAEEKGEDDHYKSETKIADDLDVAGEIVREWEWLKGELACDVILEEHTGHANGNSISNVELTSRSFCREVVLTHMDVQSLNILTPTSEDSHPSMDGNENGETEPIGASNLIISHERSIRLIDFEYAGLNARAMDIANTFCENCDMNNLSADYATQYPTPEQQNSFLEPYMQVSRPDLVHNYSTRNEWDQFLSVMREEIGRHTLVSHLGWAIWAIAQSSASSIDFDYAAYARLRLQGYHYFKAKHWS